MFSYGITRAVRAEISAVALDIRGGGGAAPTERSQINPQLLEDGRRVSLSV
jgi:hypothetical protein